MTPTESPASTTPTIAARLPIFAATWLSYAGFYVTRKEAFSLKKPIMESLHVDADGVSSLITTYLVAYALGQFFSAWLSRRMSGKKQLLLGMSTSVVCNLALGAFFHVGESAVPAIYIVLAIHGVAQATGWPCNVGIMARWTARKERGGIMATWATCYQLGSVFAKAFAGFTFDLVGLTYSFWLSSFLLALVTIAFYVLAKDKPQDKGLAPIVDGDDDPVGDSAPTAKALRRNSMRQQTFLVVTMGVIYFAFKFCRYALDSWSALILQEHFHLTTGVANYYSTAFDWIGFLGVLAAGWVSDKVFKSARITVILIMTFGCVMATGLMYGAGLSSLPAFVLLLGLVGFMCMGPDSLLSGAGAMDTGSRDQAARAAGIINGCGAVGPIVQERLIGKLKAGYGDDVVFLLMLIVTIIAAVGVAAFWAILRARKIRL